MQKKNRLALLDRNGALNVLNIKNEYIGWKKFFKWYPGAKQSIKYLKLNKYKVVIVTNQSGITRNYFLYPNVIRLHKHMQSDLKKYGTKFIIKSPKILANYGKPLVILRAGFYNKEIKNQILKEINK